MESLDLLSRVGDRLAAGDASETVLADVAHLVVPTLADSCVVAMLEPTGYLRAAAIVRADPAREQILRDLWHRIPPSTHSTDVIGYVLRNGAPVLLEHAAAPLETSGPSEVQAMFKQLANLSFMAVPLRARGRTTGVMAFATGESGRHLSSADLAIAQHIADRVALAIEVTERYAESQEDVRRRSEIVRVARRLASLRSLDRLYALLVSHAVRLTGAYGGSLYRWDSRTSKLLPLVTYRARPHPAPASPQQVIALSAVRRRRVAVHAGLALGAVERTRYASRAAPEASALAAPLVNGGRVLGAISVVRLASQPPLGHRESEILELLTGIASPTLLGIERSVALAREARTDPLTQLPNRRRSEQMLVALHRQSSRDGQPLSVAIVDLDHFKSVNDRFGHGAGDAALSWVAGRLARSLRDSDLVGRWGGEEFLVSMYGCNRETAVARLAAALRALQADSFQISGDVALNLTFSAGVAEAPADGATAADLWHAADTALYAAKTAGRARVIGYSAPVDAMIAS
ncbi:MAG: diguanylate cyclase [Chloroflexota bacterium]